MLPSYVAASGPALCSRRAGLSRPSEIMKGLPARREPFANGAALRECAGYLSPLVPTILTPPDAAGNVRKSHFGGSSDLEAGTCHWYTAPASGVPGEDEIRPG